MQTAKQTIMDHFGPFTPFNYPGNQQFDQCKERPTNFISLNDCTKNHTHMVYSYQEMMCTSVQSIQAPLCPFHTFWSKSSKFLKKKKKSHAYILILHLHPKNHNHLMYSPLKMMLTALTVIFGQFLPFYSIFGPKLIFSKNEKMPKTY